MIIKKTNPWWHIWAASFMGWGGIAVVATLAMHRVHGMSISVFGLQLSNFLSYAPLTPIVFALARRFPVQRSNWITRVLLHLGAGFLFAAAHTALRCMTFPVFDGTHYSSAIWDSNAHAISVRWDLWLGTFFFYGLDDVMQAYLPIALISHAHSYYEEYRDRELRA